MEKFTDEDGANSNFSNRKRLQYSVCAYIPSCFLRKDVKLWILILVSIGMFVFGLCIPFFSHMTHPKCSCENNLPESLAPKHVNGRNAKTKCSNGSEETETKQTTTEPKVTLTPETVTAMVTEVHDIAVTTDEPQWSKPNGTNLNQTRHNECMAIHTSGNKGFLIFRGVIYTFLAVTVHSWTEATTRCHSEDAGQLAILTSSDQWLTIKAAYEVWSNMDNINKEIAISYVDIHDDLFNVSVPELIGSQCAVLSQWRQEDERYEDSGHLDWYPKPCSHVAQRNILCMKQDSMSVQVEENKGYIVFAGMTYTFIATTVLGWDAAADTCEAEDGGILAALTTTDQWEAIKQGYQEWRLMGSTHYEIAIDRIDIHDNQTNVTIPSDETGSTCALLSQWHAERGEWDDSGHLEWYPKPCNHEAHRNVLCMKPVFQVWTDGHQKGFLKFGDTIFTFMAVAEQSSSSAARRCRSENAGDLANVTSSDQWSAIKSAYQEWRILSGNRNEVYIKGVEIHDDLNDVSLPRTGGQKKCGILSRWSAELNWWDHTGFLHWYDKPCSETGARNIICMKAG